MAEERINGRSGRTEYSIRGVSHLTRRGTPGIALVTCCTATGALLVFSNEFSILAVLSVITTLVPYIFFVSVRLP